jgi:diguanylate cyclase (GGDEF)-like protein
MEFNKKLDEDINNLINKLTGFEKMYHMMRIVDPKRKRVLDIKKNRLDTMDSYCYKFWEQDRICENCISMRAYNENNTFFKMEYTNSNIYMVTAIPVEVGGQTIVIELLNNVTDSMLIGDGNYENNRVVNSLIKNINEIAVTDSLTSVYGRRYINEKLPAELIISSVKEKPLSIILIDLDNFKDINDSLGHLAGDAVLKDIAEILKGCIRSKDDWAARYGGDEFIICLPNTDNKTAKQIAERVRSSIENKEFKYNGKAINITASFGVCTNTEDNFTTIEQFIESADKKLYSSKRHGKNKVL